MTAPAWFDGGSIRSDADSPRYPLRALTSEPRTHSAPLDEPDRALLSRIRVGDEVAFESLYREHASGLIGFATRLSGSRALAQDAVARIA